MNLKISYDKDFFIVQINGAQICKGSLRSPDEYDVKIGDIIRISTTYKRNWTVNGKAIGLQDKEDDAMYQNVYTMVTHDNPKGSKLIVSLRADSDGFVGDYLPHSLADVDVTCPNEWRFFKSSSTPSKSNFEQFKELCEIWDFGEYVRQLKIDDGLRFKRLSRVKDYYGLKNICGIVKETDKFLWVHAGKDGGGDFIEKAYDSLDELTSSVPVDYLGMKPAPNFDF